ncbi:MAG: S9 family peptidase [Clostridia bacterium]|nr:S9 family peptidase [Clostridia bacterium]
MEKITSASLIELRFLSDPLLSPDGRTALFTVARMDRAKNEYLRDLHLADLSTGSCRQLTTSGHEGIRIFEDAGTVLFESCRGEADKPEKGREKTVFYRIRLDGGEAVRAFEIGKQVCDIRKAGKGQYILLVREDLNALPEDATEEMRSEAADYHVLEELPYWANGAGYVSRIRHALYLYTPATEELRKLTDKFLNVRDFDVRGDTVLYCGDRYTDMLSLCGTAGLVSLTGNDRPLIPDNRYRVDRAAFLGGRVVLVMSDMESWGMGQMPAIYLADPEDCSLTCLSSPELAIGSAPMTDARYGTGRTFKVAGNALYFTALSRAQSSLYRLSDTGDLEELAWPGGSVFSFDVQGDTVVMTGCEDDRTAELYHLREGQFTRLSHVNDDYFARYRVSHARPIPFVNSAGMALDGWALVPEGPGPHPAVLEIHGGPRCAYGTPFFHEMQALCGRGYYVFFCNPRGSDGYGEAFADLRGRYGTIDYEDLMAFLDHALDCFPEADRSRLGACGGSYGGFMCNWIEGHTDRFAAIASQRSISNWVSDFGTSEIGHTFDRNESGTDPWQGMEVLWNMSPLKYAANARTPILFIHSLCDYNCTVDQGLQMFAAMKHFGVPTRVCLFEGENHSLSRSGKPRHRLRRLAEIEAWFEQYLERKDANG